MNVHFIGEKARTYILENGGSIVERGENAYDVQVPPGTLALGGYNFHRGHCDLYAYPDGNVLDFTVETGNHTLYLRVLKKNMLEHFGSIGDPDLLNSLAKD